MRQISVALWRQILAALLLAGACVLVVVGVSYLSDAAAWVTGGVLLAAWTFFVLGDPPPRGNA